MRALAVLLVLHGLAHLVGFAAPWGLLPESAAGAPPSAQLNALLGGRFMPGPSTARALGILWLGVALAFVVVAIGVWRRSYSTTAILLVTAISLGLCLVWWPAARIGLLVNVAILAMLLAIAVGAFRRDIAEARARVDSGATTIHTTSGPVEFAEFGTGQPVLAIHGTGGGWDQGLDASLAILPAGFRVIAPSRFGYLGTPMVADPSPENEADLHAALLDALHIDRAIVMSYSAGTAPALQFALRHPHRVAALVLVVPAAGGILPPQGKGPPPFVMNYVLKYDFPMWLCMRVAPGIMYRLVGTSPDLVASLPASEAAKVDQTVRSLLPVSRRARGIANDAHSQSGALRPYPIEHIEVPTLLISAADDLYGTLGVAKRAAELIPDARVLSFPTGGHLLAGRAPEIKPALASFLRARRQAREPAMAGR